MRPKILGVVTIVHEKWDRSSEPSSMHLQT
jgi:hypothetical protein